LGLESLFDLFHDVDFFVFCLRRGLELEQGVLSVFDFVTGVFNEFVHLLEKFETGVSAEESHN